MPDRPELFRREKTDEPIAERADLLELTRRAYRYCHDRFLRFLIAHDVQSRSDGRSRGDPVIDQEHGAPQPERRPGLPKHLPMPGDLAQLAFSLSLQVFLVRSRILMGETAEVHIPVFAHGSDQFGLTRDAWCARQNHIQFHTEFLASAAPAGTPPRGGVRTNGLVSSSALSGWANCRPASSRFRNMILYLA